MITPTKSSNRINTDFVVCDIENRSDGSVISIQTYDGKNHSAKYDWGTWLAWIVAQAKTDKKYRTIYAHNGGGWDWLSFIEWSIKNNPTLYFSTVENGNRIIAVTLRIGERFSIRLTDSLYLFHCSLDQAGRTYAGKGKVDTDSRLPEELWEQDRNKYWEYAYWDTELLYDSMIAFTKLIYEKIAPISRLGLTLPSTAMRCFTTSYLDREITTPSNDKVKTMLREGYVGGRVEVFSPGYKENINVYDFNSLYPSVMYDTMVPTCGNVRFTETVQFGRPGVYRIRFSQQDRSKRAILLYNGVGAYSGEGVYYEPEIRRLVQQARGFVTVLEGCYFPESAIIFRKYVQTLYHLRMQDKESPLGNTCKLLMNSLYGKYAQRSERTKTCHLSADEVLALIRNGTKVETINEQYGVYRVSESRTVNFEHVGIAGTITSEARARLWESIGANTCYVDTDSIHTTNTMPTDSRTLGALKLEYSGEAVYVGKKLYALRNTVGEKVRAKGIRVGGKLGFRLDFDALRTLDTGSVIPCTFKGASTANRVLRGDKACVFSERTRRIRKTV